MMQGFQPGCIDESAWYLPAWGGQEEVAPSPTRSVRTVLRERGVGYTPRTPRLVASAAQVNRLIWYERQAMRVVATQATSRVVPYWKTARIVTAKVTITRSVSSMGTAKKVDDLDMDESAEVEFNFTDELGAATVTDAVVTVDLREGQDPTPNDLKSGTRVLVVGGQKVTQMLHGKMPKCSYAVRCVATCSDGLDRTAVALIKVVRL